MSKLLVDVTRGFDALKEDPEVVGNITGRMTVFPLCCSTGVLQSMGATHVTDQAKGHFQSPNAANMPDEATIKGAAYIHQIIEKARAFPMVWPREAAAWYALSLCLLKVTEGKDTGNVGGYSNYKAGQIAMADRVTDEKRSGKRFNSYNIVFGTDQFVSWLEERDGALGEVLASEPQDGAHGARTRACIYTPNIKALKKFHDAHLPKVRDHALALIAHYGKTAKKTAPAKGLAKAAAW